MRLLLMLPLLFLFACGGEETEIIMIGPYTQRCHGAFFEQDCLMVREEGSSR